MYGFSMTVARALAVDVAPGQFARAPRQHRQGAEDLAFEVQHAMREIVEEGRQRAVDMRVLAALVAVRPGQRRSAVEACRLVRVAVGRLAGADLLPDALREREQLPRVRKPLSELVIRA